MIPVDPPQRNGQPLMKLSLAAYSFAGIMVTRGTPEQRAGAKMTIEKFIDYCAEQQLGAAELTGYYFPKNITTDYLLSLRQQTHRLGIDISGTAIGNDFCVADQTAWEAQLADCRRWIDYAAIMGAPVIRIFAGNIPKGSTETEAVARCVEGINRSLDYAAQQGIFLAIENHGGITATADQLLNIISRVQPSPWFGVNFDSGNFHTEDPYDDLARIAPYSVNAQIKVSVADQTTGQRIPMDLPRVIKTLKQAGYRGYVVLEFDEPDPFEKIPGHLNRLRELIQA